ncbi:MAG TPA: sigma-70 family RNA polymerase sigma factor [Rhizomicrobium sp.]|nr:sigma-70 family RNA polymerase sigma factor [Rhizomicrobium sp.]
MNDPAPQDVCALVAQAGAGDRRAQEALIKLYRQRVARFVIAQTRDREIYEDLCQTVFVKMVLGLPRLRAPESFEPWLFRIARNVCRDHLRARLGWRRLFVSFDDGHDVAAPEPEGEIPLDQRIERLPAEQRALLRLSLDGGRSYEDLARLSRISMAALKSRLHRARENLKSLMLAEDRE